MTHIAHTPVPRQPAPDRPRRSAVLRRSLAAATALATLTVAAACGGADGEAAAAASANTAGTASSALQGDADLERTLAGILESHHANHEFVGAVLSLREADGATVTVTTGSQTVDADSPPVDPAVPWNVGSVTKTFVAVVALQLAEEGELDLDAGIERFLPDLADADRITPRQLLQHTSGLNEYQNTPAVEADAQREWTPSELIAVAEAAGRTGEPGGPHRYSNTNYIVLGEIIEDVTGNPWEEEVHERIAEPLGMRDTGVVAVGGPRGYTREGEAFVDDTESEHPSLGGAAGGLQSTTSDLLTFTEALVEGRLLSDRSLAEMSAFIPAEDLSQFGVVHEYGLGLEEYATDQLTAVGHMGIGAAHSAFIGFDAESGTAVAVTMNADTPGPQAIMGIEALAAASS
ncbi:serine hydrolase domain-containing protein [Geodermatophilus sp. CPCC 205761]|uniref:serine hydrolase domain-containing protein n=1 Tax=Geodermatophilus sp. CPCC 205761 TaxID=2936597 RepID=UPI003EEE262D